MGNIDLNGLTLFSYQLPQATLCRDLFHRLFIGRLHLVSNEVAVFCRHDEAVVNRKAWDAVSDCNLLEDGTSNR